MDQSFQIYRNSSDINLFSSSEEEEDDKINCTKGINNKENNKFKNNILSSKKDDKKVFSQLDNDLRVNFNNNISLLNHDNHILINSKNLDNDDIIIINNLSTDINSVTINKNKDLKSINEVLLEFSKSKEASNKGINSILPNSIPPKINCISKNNFAKPVNLKYEDANNKMSMQDNHCKITFSVNNSNETNNAIIKSNSIDVNVSNAVNDIDNNKIKYISEKIKIKKISECSNLLKKIFFNDNLEISDEVNNIDVNKENKHNDKFNSINLTNIQSSEEIHDKILKREDVNKSDKTIDNTSNFTSDNTCSIIKEDQISINFIQELKKKHDMTLKLISSVDLNKLPDGGVKLKNNLLALKKQIEKANIDVKNNCSAVIAISNNAQDNCENKLITKSKINTIIKYTEPHFNMINKDNPIQLYGGRMNSSRLKHVGQVTNEALERLHSQYLSCPKSEIELTDPIGLKVPLLIHQKQALTWLTWREKEFPRGGILADDMGLGKTLTMISLILKQKEFEANNDAILSTGNSDWLNKSKKVLHSTSTLIVCPASLVHQWEKEVEKRVKHGFLKVKVYHGSKRKCSINEFLDHDITLTTYNLISQEVGIPDDLKNDKNLIDMPCVEEQEIGKKDDSHHNNISSLQRIHWKRIIIDEGHTIKNHKSNTALSICRLKADVRWVLTGTPIHNDLLDIYSLLRFLRCSPFDEYRLWKKQVDNKSENGTQRLNTLIKTLLLRRTKDQICEKTGKPLVSLPQKTCEIHSLELSNPERLIYDKIFNHSKAKMLQYLHQVESKFGNNHAIKYNSSTSSKIINNKLIISMNNNNGNENTDMAHYKSNADSNFEKLEKKLNDLSISTSNNFNQIDVNIDKKKNQTNIENNEKSNGTQILLMLLRLRQCCSHLNLMKQAIEEDDIKISSLEIDLEDHMNQLSIDNEKQYDVPEAKSSSIEFDQLSASTKINALLALMCKVRSESKQNGIKTKSVIVSQWTKMLDIVDLHLRKNKFKSCLIQGDVPPRKRSELVEAFNTDDSGPEVMLLSLRAGGVGLNLIGGNHLYLIDMHWNPALEQQSCDRIYRIGQKKNVFIHRFVCKNTIEEKIVQLQKHKMNLANDVLSGNKITDHKLSLEDLKMLFGLTSGNTFLNNHTNR